MNLSIRRARRDDVARILELIRSGAAPGTTSVDNDGRPLADGYFDAFAEIDANANQLLVVAEEDGVVVGTLLFTRIRQLHHHGGATAEVESVHVAAERRGLGIGSALMAFAIDEARRRGCFRMQLTSNRVRRDAHRFYERLGFSQSHAGFKMNID